jgi:general secretion pathway protein D
MKTSLLTVILVVLTAFELCAQPIGPNRRLPRFGNTNGVPGTQPRYFPQAPGAAGAPGNPALNPAGLPGGVPGLPAAPGAGAGAGGAPGQPLSSTYNASAAFAAQPEEMVAPGTIDFEGVALSQVLDIYAKLVHRTLLRGPLPEAQIVLKTETPLTRTEAIEALQAVLALNNISLVNMGDKFVKVLQSTDAGGAGGEIDRTGSTNIPALGSYVTHVIQLKYVKPSEMVQVIQPFARLPNSILPIDGNGILVLRDYAENVKRMLEMIEQVDVSVPAEYISEVIPIRYAKVDDIANALSALGGGGGTTVSIGTPPGNSQISGLAPNRGGLGGGGISGLGGVGGAGGLGGGAGGAYGGGNTQFGARPQTTPNGTPNGATTFQQRLNSIINGTGAGAAGGNSKQDIQLFGETKIIPNESSSSLLIYATRQDMEVIKGIIAKLDVPLAQVLVEAAIIDYSLGPNTFNFGVSAAQNPVQNGAFIGGGGVNNSSGGSPFIQFVQDVTANRATNGLITSLTKSISEVGSSGTNANFANNLPGGLSYFGNIGPNWDVAMNAAQSDSHASVIQRPRIQTSQAKPAQFFVGDTVPYVTGNSYGTAYGSGVSYSQLSVGVELDVTPFINPEGLVVMDIQQEIDDLNGYTTIQNVGQVPNTIKRTLNAEIAVRNRETVMLGGFIKANKSTSRAGVPFLMDIPILGNLFLQRNDSKQREELIVLMRPTVLDTPKEAAEYTRVEEGRLPGVARAEADNSEDEIKLIEAERKREQQKYKANPKFEGFFTPQPLQPDDASTNSPPVETSPTESKDSLPTPSTSGASAPEVITPVPAPVHPNATMMTPPTAPATPATPTEENNAPLDSAAMQQRAAAALAEKMVELNLNSTNASH